MIRDLGETIEGVILGTALGDALGLPMENFRPARARLALGNGERFCLLFGHGMFSDDTEHTLMTAQALTASGGDVDLFRRSLAWRMRFWLLGIPAAVGKATLISTLRLWIGFPPHCSGVRSAGNGPAMRAAVIGASFPNDLDRVDLLVKSSTALTHRDERALCGARLIALAAACSAGERVPTCDSFMELVTARNVLEMGGEMATLLQRAISSVKRHETTEAFCERQGWKRGISGYICHTVPACIHAWLSHPEDWQRAVNAVIRSGGDTDTTAAIVGGIVGSRVGSGGLPASLVAGLWEWPRSVSWMRRVASRLSSVLVANTGGSAISLNAPGVLVRNLLFLMVILFHALLIRPLGFLRSGKAH